MGYNYNGGPIFFFFGGGLFFLGGGFSLVFPRENSSFLTFWTDLA